MIVYDLRCSHGHRFEGWFASADEFARQQQASLVRCPICDVPGVERLPSAHIAGARAEPTLAQPPAAAQPPVPQSGAVAGLPAEMLAKLREIVQNTENVGRRFPEEARKIHYEEVPARPIRGQASLEEAQALSEEGIAFAPLPPVLTEPTQ